MADAAALSLLAAPPVSGRAEVQARQRFLWLCASLLAVYGVIFWCFVPGRTDEYWDHTAAIRALTESFLHPVHPLMQVPLAGERWFNPYLLLMAGIAKAAGLMPVDVLKLGGPLNLALLFVGLYRFAAVSTGLGRGVAGWMLISYLFFWTTRGAMVRELGYSPAAFVASGTPLLWWLALRLVNRPTAARMAWVVAAGSILWLCHQLAAGVALINAAWLMLLEPSSPWRRRALLALGMACGILLLSECWPYFSSVRLLLGSFRQYGYGSSHIHQAWEARLYLALLGPNLLGLVLLTTRQGRSLLERFLQVSAGSFGVLWAVLLAARSQYHSAAILAVGNAFALRVGLELARPAGPGWSAILRTALILAILLQVKFTAGWFHQMYGTPSGAAYRQMLQDYRQLPRHVGRSDVVLSDLWTSWQVPTFAGKTLTRPPGHEVDYSVPYREQQQRARALQQLLDPATSGAIRQALLQRYHIRYVLVNRVLAPEFDLRHLVRMGETVWETPRLTLVRLSAS
ncbi:MAG: hypothetical protein HY599_06475 [Candidatus Omnitrophica bacterium]|nr:hypothetical protein [Candidatus Omnitrophota bacterium]